MEETVPMIRFRNFLPLFVAALVGTAILGFPASARADLEIALQEDGVDGGDGVGVRHVVATAASFTAATYSGTYGDFTVTVFSGSSDNAADLSDLLSSTNKVKNNAGTAKTLRLWVTQDGYTLPLGSPLSVESGLAGTVNTGTIGFTGIFQAYADKNNNLFGTGDFTNGAQNASPNGSSFDTGSATGSFTRSGDYSLTSVTVFDMSGGASGNFSAHVNVTAPATAPAPAGVVLALSALPFLGIGSWLGRRKLKVQNS
jgi:hypothetical protein